MNAKGTPLTDDSVQQQRCRLGNLIVLNKELLKLVNDQERTGNLFRPAGTFVSWNILHAKFAEEVAPSTQLVIHTLQDTEGKLPVALDCNDSCMGQLLCSITLELHPLFEVHKIKFNLVRAAPERQVGDDDMEQC